MKIEMISGVKQNGFDKSEYTVTLLIFYQNTFWICPLLPWVLHFLF